MEVHSTLGNGEAGDLPQHVGVQRVILMGHDHLADGGVNNCIVEGDFFDDTADGKAGRGYGADQTVGSNGNGPEAGFTGGQLEAFFEGCVLGGGIFHVGGIVDLAVVRFQFHGNILAVKTGFGRNRRCGRAEGIQFCLDGGIGDVVQQIHRIQKLVLFHIDFAQRLIQLCCGLICDGPGQGVFCLCVVSGVAELVCQLNGHVIILIGQLVCPVIEPRGKVGVAIGGIVACLTEQHIPGEGTVINKAIPCDAD